MSSPTKSRVGLGFKNNDFKILCFKKKTSLLAI
jgi:hypothetical protein